MEKHTPGPWKAIIDTDAEYEGKRMTDFDIFSGDGVQGVQITRGYGGLDDIHFPKREQGEANAHLIAASPTMYKTLREVSRLLPAQMKDLGDLVDKTLLEAEGRE